MYLEPKTAEIELKKVTDIISVHQETGHIFLDEKTANNVMTKILRMVLGSQNDTFEPMVERNATETPESQGKHEMNETVVFDESPVLKKQKIFGVDPNITDYSFSEQELHVPSPRMDDDQPKNVKPGGDEKKSKTDRHLEMLEFL